MTTKHTYTVKFHFIEGEETRLVKEFEVTSYAAGQKACRDFLNSYPSNVASAGLHDYGHRTDGKRQKPSHVYVKNSCGVIDTALTFWH